MDILHFTRDISTPVVPAADPARGPANSLRGCTQPNGSSKASVVRVVDTAQSPHRDQPCPPPPPSDTRSSAGNAPLASCCPEQSDVRCTGDIIGFPEPTQNSYLQPLTPPPGSPSHARLGTRHARATIYNLKCSPCPVLPVQCTACASSGHIDKHYP